MIGNDMPMKQCRLQQQPVAVGFSVSQGSYTTSFLGSCARHLGLAVVTSLFLAPHLYYHELTLLLLPILGFAIILVEAGVLRQEKSMYLPAAFSLLLLLGDISPARFIITYLVMAFLVVGLLLPIFPCFSPIGRGDGGEGKNRKTT
jgi:hypothetical protein